MAYSQSLTDSTRRKGQTAMLCQLCETDLKLKWKCLECKLMMCQRCRDKVHPKFPSAEDHTIIDLKEISKHQIDTESKPELTRIKCGLHSGQSCCLYCKTCQELVCQTCITKTHNEHKFNDIDEEYKFKIEKIRNGQENIEKEMRALTVCELKLKQIKSNEQSDYAKVKQEILDYDKALKNEIQKHTDKLLKELDQMREVSISKSFEEKKRKLMEFQSQIQKKIQEINNLLQPSNAKEMFSGYDSLLKFMEMNIPSVTTSFKGVPKFTQGDKTQIPLILGKLEDVSIQISTELQVDKKFKTGLKHITSLVSCPDGSLRLCNTVSGTIRKVKPNEDRLSVIENYKTIVNDAALLPFGDLLLSSELSDLKLIPSNSPFIKGSVYTVSPLLPMAVHVTCDNKVIVGAVDSSDIPATGPRQVIVMDQTGHHQKVFQYDRHNEPLFSFPRYITSNSQGTIAVVDQVSDDYRGRIMILDQEGEVRNIYTGHPDFNNEAFTPRGITTTPSDNFVLADMCNHNLHILNSEGEILNVYNTEEMGIIIPWSLAWSSTGQLYIGSSSYKDSKENVFTVNNFFY